MGFLMMMIFWIAFKMLLMKYSEVGKNNKLDQFYSEKAGSNKDSSNGSFALRALGLRALGFTGSGEGSGEGSVGGSDEGSVGGSAGTDDLLFRYPSVTGVTRQCYNANERVSNSSGSVNIFLDKNLIALRCFSETDVRKY